VGHQQDGRALVGERPNLLPEQPPPDRVDVVRGLVEHDHPAGDDGGHREGDEPLHPAGESRPVGVHPLAQRQRFHQAVAPHADVGRSTPAQPADQLDRLARRQPVDRKLRLRLKRAHAPRIARIGDRVATGDQDRAGIREEQPDDLVDQRRLAGAVVAEQPQYLPGVGREGDLVVGAGGGSPPETRPVRLGHTLDLEQHRWPPPGWSGDRPAWPGRPCSRTHRITCHSMSILLRIHIPRGILAP
jgi:hypothetical protein